MSRERFEKLFPVPEWASYFGGEDGYKPTDNPLTNSKRSSAVQLINFRLQGYQSRQPEIDELIGALEVARDYVAVCADDVQLAHRFEALIAKHKGEA